MDKHLPCCPAFRAFSGVGTYRACLASDHTTFVVAVDTDSRLGKIQQHHIRTLLHAFDNNFPAIRGDVKVANVKAGSEPGQLPQGAALQVDQPEILVLNLSPQK